MVSDATGEGLSTFTAPSPSPTSDANPKLGCHSASDRPVKYQRFPQPSPQQLQFD